MTFLMHDFWDFGFHQHLICEDVLLDPHLEANASDDSVGILGFAEQVLGRHGTKQSVKTCQNP